MATKGKKKVDYLKVGKAYEKKAGPRKGKELGERSLIIQGVISKMSHDEKSFTASKPAIVEEAMRVLGEKEKAKLQTDINNRVLSDNYSWALTTIRSVHPGTSG